MQAVQQLGTTLRRRPLARRRGAELVKSTMSLTGLASSSLSRVPPCAAPFPRGRCALAPFQLGHHIRRPAGARSGPARSASGTTGRPPRRPAGAGRRLSRVLGRHHHFRRFFADLFEESVRALRQQPGHVAGPGFPPFAGLRLSMTSASRARDEASFWRSHGFTCRWRRGLQGPARRTCQAPSRAGRNSCDGRCGRQSGARAQAASFRAGARRCRSPCGFHAPTARARILRP